MNKSKTVIYFIDGDNFEFEGILDLKPSNIGAYFYFRIMMPGRTIDIPLTSIKYIEKIL